MKTLTAVLAILTAIPLCASAQNQPLQLASLTQPAKQPGVHQLGAAEIGSAEPPQVKDEVLAGVEKFAKNASDVSDVNLDPKMMGMVHGGKSDLASKMDFIVVHSYTYDKPGMYSIADVQVYSRKLQDGSWSCFVHTRDSKTGESTDICSRATGETNELIIITAEPLELTFVHMKGRMSMNDLMKMHGMGGPTPPTPPSKP